MRCDICQTEGAKRYFFGGLRPRPTYRPSDCPLCPACCEVAKKLAQDGKLFWRAGTDRDTTNSRFSTLKAAVKRIRFGNPNARIKQSPK